MSVLDNFSVFNFNEGVPYASFTNHGITFNKAVIMKLGYPNRVILLIDEDSRRIAIQVSDESNERSVAFFKPKKSNVLSVRWNGRDLLNTIQGITGWNLSVDSYRVDGVLLKEDRAFLFDLNTATALNNP